MNGNSRYRLSPGFGKEELDPVVPFLACVLAFNGASEEEGRTT